MSPSFVAKNAGLTQAVVYRAMHGRNMQKQSVIKLLQGINLPIEEAREKGFLIER
jgi:hypothetical protein